mgnify:CR=1 FL=1
MEVFSSDIPSQASSSEFIYGYYNLGIKFIPQKVGLITSVHFWLQPEGLLENIWNIWLEKDLKVSAIATGTFDSLSFHGWQTSTLENPQKVEVGNTYIVSVPAQLNYPFNHDFHREIIQSENCIFPIDAGVFSYPYRKGEPPLSSFRASTYYRDFTFEAI